MTVAAAVGALLASVSPGLPLPPIGAHVERSGWLEAELDGGLILHSDAGTIALVPGREAASDTPDLAGRAVRVRGVFLEPWHPRARPPLRADEIGAWTLEGIEAPGVAPARRSWMRFRLAARSAVRERIRRLFPDHAGLIAALLLADRSDLDPERRSRFIDTGTAHLLAISGFHVGVLAGWVVMALGMARVPRPLRPGVATGIVWIYVALLGFPTSALRAALLITAFTLGRTRGRPVHPLAAWGAALAITAAVAPAALRGAGAQLSFAGSFGLIVWARPWTRSLVGGAPGPGARRATRARYVIGAAVAASAAAQVATAGIVAWHFQRVPLVGLPASVLATPPVAIALPGALLALVLAPLAPLAAAVAAGVAGVLDATLWLVDLLARFDGALWAGPLHLVGPLVGASMGVGWVGWHARRSGPGRHLQATLRDAGARRRRARVRGGAVGAWVGFTLSPLAAGLVERPLQMHILDVGQGDAIAIRSPRGAWTLIDTGPGPAPDLLRALARAGVRRVRTLVLTHPDLDHVGGAAGLIEALPVGRIVGPGLLRGTAP
ncbi:MAG: ComEC/Rec2 family competence protein, partial [Longimicrobiales bacterium]|nr:ComEC/Rec2 family competence protein [Longimicrobiales bacterium]